MAVRRISPTITYTHLRASDVHLVTPTDAYIYVGGTEDGPNLRYNKGTSKWQFSNNGTVWSNMGSGGVSGSYDDAIKVVELVTIEIPADVNHLLPESATYTLSEGNKLDIYLNGQLLTHDQPGSARDYIEVNISTVKFHFIVPQSHVLVYTIKQ